MENSIKLDDIHTNGEKTCVDCGDLITRVNDSRWEVFVEDGVTQPICIMCDAARDAERAKEDSKRYQ